MASARSLAPPRTVDPYYHQAERMAEIERRLALLEQGKLIQLWEVGAGAPVPGFTNSYANYQPAAGLWAKCAFWKVGNRVYIQGLVYSSIANANGAAGGVFTLPLGYRPTQMHMFNQTGNAVAARVDVLPSGEVRNQSTAGFAAGAVAASSWFLTLDGINFAVGA